MSEEYWSYEKEAPGTEAGDRLFRMLVPKSSTQFPYEVPFTTEDSRTPSLHLSKRLFDLTVTLLGLVFLAPLLLLIAVVIKMTSKGPVFFYQNRYGLNGRLFRTYKFRTMFSDTCDPTGRLQTRKNDPRITPIGHLLRRSNFDELPQLLNVLKGDMSLVGPRPHVPGMLAAGRPYEIFDSRYMSRHQVLPGITGLAQVNGWRGETVDPQAAMMRLECDLEYIRSQSLWLDVKILVRTIFKELASCSGY